MSNEIFESLVQLYDDVLNDDDMSTHIRSVYSSSNNSGITAWSFSSINRYQNHVGACTITVHFDTLSHYVRMVQIDYDAAVVCVWIPPEDPTYRDFVNEEYSEVLDDDFNVVMAIARDGFFDSGEEVEENLYDDDEMNEDGTVNIPLELTDSELALIARAAHAQDITINEFMNQAVTNMLAEMGIDE